MADDNQTPTTPETTDRKPPIAVRPAVPFNPTGAPAAGNEARPATVRLNHPTTPATTQFKPVGDDTGDIAPTIRIRPVVVGQPTATVTPTTAAPKPGAAPLPPGPKPLKPEQVEAAKGKTSRISLDAALVGGAADGGGPKTIRLKRPTDAPVGKITSHLGGAAAAATAKPQKPGADLVPPIPTQPPEPVVNRFTTSVTIDDADAATPARHTAAVPTEAMEEEQPSLTRRKTIRVKRPGAPVIVRAPGAAAAHAGADDSATEAAPVAVALPVTVERTNPFFPILAIITIFILIAVIVVLIAPDGKLFDTAAWPTNTPTLSLPGMAPIPGRG